MTYLIILLVVVTIGYEGCVELMEEHFFNEGISKLLLGKMLAELAILGFVSFTATVIMQFVELPGGEETKLTFEYAHVLMFLTAVFFAIEIAVISTQLPTVLADLEKKDAADAEEVLHVNNQHWYARMRRHDHDEPNSLKRLMLSCLHWAEFKWSESYLNTHMHYLVSMSRLKVLRFQFMTRNELLASHKFSWSVYLSRAMAHEIESLIEINFRSWAMMIFVLAVSLPISFRMSGAIYAFTLAGWLLLAVELNVLWFVEAVIDQLILSYHLQRRSAEKFFKLQSSERADSPASPPPLEHRKPSLDDLLELSEKEIKEQSEGCTHVPFMCLVREQELQMAVRASKTPTLVAKLHDSYASFVEAHPEVLERAFAGRALRMLPYIIQTVLLAQCMYQALILTMLGRYVFLTSTGSASALGMLLVMWGPTTIMSLFVTPQVLRNFSLAASAVHVRADILDDMRAEFTQSGDYSAATQALELLLKSKLSEGDLHDEELVRAKVKDLTKLGEMKWRYRVVEEGDSPRDGAITVLTEAKEVLEGHMRLRKEQDGESDDKLRMSWAAELSEVCQGLGVTRLIFNTHRGEDVEIEQLLREAQVLRQGAGLRAALAETFNALGTLKQKQKVYTDAEHFYCQSLSIRKSLPEGEDHGKQKQQSIAQSLTSLGVLFTAVADETEAGSPRRTDLLQKALSHLEKAKEAYVKGFHEGHPKVAWALEGLAHAFEKVGNLKAAQSALADAIAIRRNLQFKDKNKEMFTKELKANEAKREAVALKRQEIRSRLTKLQHAAVVSVGSRSSVDS